MVSGVRLRHAGTFNMSEQAEKWRPFRSDQQVVTRRSGFDWNGRITLLPGIEARVHDAYIAGHGLLKAALIGLVPVADMHRSSGMDAGELTRFFAEVSVTYRIAVGPKAGQKIFTLQIVPAREPEPEQQGDHRGAANAGGFSLHAGLGIQPHQREKLERLCRHVSSAPIAVERLALTSSGQVRITLKTPYRDATTHDAIITSNGPTADRLRYQRSGIGLHEWSWRTLSWWRSTTAGGRTCRTNLTMMSWNWPWQREVLRF